MDLKTKLEMEMTLAAQANLRINIRANKYGSK